MSAKTVCEAEQNDDSNVCIIVNKFILLFSFHKAGHKVHKKKKPP